MEMINQLVSVSYPTLSLEKQVLTMEKIRSCLIHKFVAYYWIFILTALVLNKTNRLFTTQRSTQAPGQFPQAYYKNEAKIVYRRRARRKLHHFPVNIYIAPRLQPSGA